jgi:hypothetical protein
MIPSALNKYSNYGPLCVVVIYFDILEECTGLIAVDAEVIWRKKCVGHIW